MKMFENTPQRKGFTLIELLVVIAITALLSVGVVTNMISFQKDAKLDSFTKEFASALETARNRSVNGESPARPDIFETYTEEGDELPYWVVEVDGTNKQYVLYSNYKKGTDPVSPTPEVKEVTRIPDGNKIMRVSDSAINFRIDFKRLNGKTAHETYEVYVSGNLTEKEQVEVDEFGNVTIKKVNI